MAWGSAASAGCSGARSGGREGEPDGACAASSALSSPTSVPGWPDGAVLTPVAGSSPRVSSVVVEPSAITVLSPGGSADARGSWLRCQLDECVPMDEGPGGAAGARTGRGPDVIGASSAAGNGLPPWETCRL